MDRGLCNVKIRKKNLSNLDAPDQSINFRGSNFKSRKITGGISANHSIVSG